MLIASKKLACELTLRKALNVNKCTRIGRSINIKDKKIDVVQMQHIYFAIFVQNAELSKILPKMLKNEYKSKKCLKIELQCFSK